MEKRNRTSSRHPGLASSVMANEEPTGTVGDAMGRWYLASACAAVGELVHTASSHTSPRVPKDRQAQCTEQGLRREQEGTIASAMPELLAEGILQSRDSAPHSVLFLCSERLPSQ